MPKQLYFAFLFVLSEERHINILIHIHIYIYIDSQSDIQSVNFIVGFMRRAVDTVRF